MIVYSATYEVIIITKQTQKYVNTCRNDKGNGDKVDSVEHSLFFGAHIDDCSH